MRGAGGKEGRMYNEGEKGIKTKEERKKRWK